MNRASQTQQQTGFSGKLADGARSSLSLSRVLARLLARVPDNPIPRTLSYLVFVVAAAFCYFYRVGDLAFVVDEIYHGVVAQSILRDGVPNMPDGTLYLKGVLFSYLGAGATWLLGSPEAGVRVVSGLCLLLTGFYVERITRRHVSERLAWLALGGWLLHPWVVEFARWGRLYTLATLLLTASVSYLLDYDRQPSKGRLLASWGLLLVSVLVYPMGFWAAAVYALFFVHRTYQLQPRSRRRIIRVTIGGTIGVVAVSYGFWLLSFRYRELELANWAYVFSGSTGSISPSVSRFVGYSPYYFEFYFRSLRVMAWAAIALLLIVWVRKKDYQFVRTSLLVFLLSFGAVVFVACVHLQKATPRYLFPSLPFSIIGAVLVLESLLHPLSLVRRSQLEVVAVIALLLDVVGSRVLKVPLREHGDLYPYPSFSPSPQWRRHPDFRTSAAIVAEQAKKWDLVIVSQEMFHFNYAGKEPDYVFAPRRRVEGLPLAPYMSKTRQIGACEELKELLYRQRYRATWFNVWGDVRTNACLYEISVERPLQLIYKDKRRDGIRVYRLPRYL